MTELILDLHGKDKDRCGDGDSKTQRHGKDKYKAFSPWFCENEFDTANSKFSITRNLSLQEMLTEGNLHNSYIFVKFTLFLTCGVDGNRGLGLRLAVPTDDNEARLPSLPG